MFYLYQFIRILLHPLIRFILPLFSSSLKKRINFEHKNHLETSTFFKAHYAFEVSSEGELEQIIEVLLYLLNKDKRVELIYCSPSVEHRVIELRSQFPHSLRTYRLPIITYHPWTQRNNANRWLSADTLILCRYDFFVELIYYGHKKGKEIFLLSASLNGWEGKNKFTKLYLKFCYRKFDKIITATPAALAEFAKKIGVNPIKMRNFDFRTITIQKRIIKRKDILNSKFSIFSDFEKEVLHGNTSIIFGSFWEFEVSLFCNEQSNTVVREDYIHCIAPHLLDEASLQSLCTTFHDKKIKTYVLTATTTRDELLTFYAQFLRDGGVWVFNVKGVLCELYSSFEFAYVGGGFEVSVHSLLEPYLSSCLIVCGPKVSRSEEYQLIILDNKKRINILEKTQDFYLTLHKYNKSKIENNTFFNKTDDFPKQMKWLGF